MENYIVSARKYRPSTFSSVVGQKALTATLKNAIAQDRLAHAYLFCGSRGVGKTSCARIFAKTINCSHPTTDGDPCNECDNCRAFNEGRSLNIIELDAASNNSVDDIRQLVEQVQIPPTQGRYRVFIIDEVHMLSNAAFNAFLKTLEEPPAYVVFILATTEKHKVIPTILSRCQIYDFSRITITDMVDHLSYVASQEGIQAEPAALGIIARKADGAMRDALSIFDQVAASCRGKITYEQTVQNLNVLDDTYYFRLMQTFIEHDVQAALLIYKEIRDHGFDSHRMINGLAEYLRNLMVARTGATMTLLDTDDQSRQQLSDLAQEVPIEFFYDAMSLCNEADLNYRQASSKTFLTELLLIRLCQLLGPSPIYRGKGEGLSYPLASTSSTSAPTPAAPTPVAAPSVKTTAQTVAPTQSHPTSPAPQTSSTPPPPVHHNGQPRRLQSTAATLAAATASRQTVQQQPSNTTSNRHNRYSHEALLKAWHSFASAHPDQHLLVNTFRASLPEPSGDNPDKYIVTVENPLQVQLFETLMPSLLSHLHNAVANDDITLVTKINTAGPSPRLMNDYEILTEMKASIPYLENLIQSLDLKLM